jgi:hypothetical protein
LIWRTSPRSRTRPVGEFSMGRVRPYPYKTSFLCCFLEGTESPFCSCRGYLHLSRPQQFFGREITSLLLFYCLSLLVSRILSYMCNLNPNLFFIILFVNPTPVTLELRFDSIPFVLRSHRSLYKYRR